MYHKRQEYSTRNQNNQSSQISWSYMPWGLKHNISLDLMRQLSGAVAFHKRAEVRSVFTASTLQHCGHQPLLRHSHGISYTHTHAVHMKHSHGWSNDKVVFLRHMVNTVVKARMDCLQQYLQLHTWYSGMFHHGTKFSFVKKM